MIRGGIRPVGGGPGGPGGRGETACRTRSSEAPAGLHGARAARRGECACRARAAAEQHRPRTRRGPRSGAAHADAAPVECNGGSCHGPLGRPGYPYSVIVDANGDQSHPYPPPACRHPGSVLPGPRHRRRLRLRRGRGALPRRSCAGGGVPPRRGGVRRARPRRRPRPAHRRAVVVDGRRDPHGRAGAELVADERRRGDGGHLHHRAAGGHPDRPAPDPGRGRPVVPARAHVRGGDGRGRGVDERGGGRDVQVRHHAGLGPRPDGAARLGRPPRPRAGTSARVGRPVRDRHAARRRRGAGPDVRPAPSAQALGRVPCRPRPRPRGPVRGLGGHPGRRDLGHPRCPAPAPGALRRADRPRRRGAGDGPRDPAARRVDRDPASGRSGRARRHGHRVPGPPLARAGRRRRRGPTQPRVDSGDGGCGPPAPDRAAPRRHRGRGPRADRSRGLGRAAPRSHRPPLPPPRGRGAPRPRPARSPRRDRPDGGAARPPGSGAGSGQPAGGCRQAHRR